MFPTHCKAMKIWEENHMNHMKSWEAVMNLASALARLGWLCISTLLRHGERTLCLRPEKATLLRVQHFQCGLEKSSCSYGRTSRSKINWFYQIYVRVWSMTKEAVPSTAPTLVVLLQYRECERYPGGLSWDCGRRVIWHFVHVIKPTSPALSRVWGHHSLLDCHP